jgi:hypothetical protein
MTRVRDLIMPQLTADHFIFHAKSSNTNIHVIITWRIQHLLKLADMGIYKLIANTSHMQNLHMRTLWLRTIKEYHW